MAVKWPDKKTVTILTMMHNNNGMMDQERQTGTSQETKACP
jgi:hypothetical protein